MRQSLTLEELEAIADAVGERKGWDFSLVRSERDPDSWDYSEVVRRYLEPSSRVLDVGTGGGEKFLELAPHFGSVVGIDSDQAMTEAARENTPPSLADRVSFQTMPAESLQFPDGTFDVVLNRHAPVCVEEIIRVLRPGGLFITQQVGERNTHNICSVFGCGPGGKYERDPSQEMGALSEGFERLGCKRFTQGEYDVRCWFIDLESFVFWLKAIPIPEDFEVERHWRKVAEIVGEYSTARGLETNEHRELLIVRTGMPSKGRNQGW